MSQTFYEVLGVSPDATTDEITSAYRERIKETHPDVSDEADAEEQAKRVIEAKEVLVDQEERERYDRLGHRAYVNQTSVDGNWDVSTSGPDPDPTDQSQSGPRGSQPGTGAGAESVYEGTWATNGVSDSEAESSSDTNSTSSDTSGQSASAASGSGAASDSQPGPGEKRKRRARSRGANATTNVGEATGWAAGADGRHAVRQNSKQKGFQREYLFPSNQSPVLLVSTFICYPAMVFSSFFEPFPLVVNIVVGCCTLLLIAYLMSMPEVGVYVFGGWSVLAMLASIGYGIFPFSLLGLLLLGPTWLPLAFTLITYQVLRW